MKAREEVLCCSKGESPLLRLLAWVMVKKASSKNRLWFRGQPNADPDWRLRPGVFRTFKVNKGDISWYARDAECDMTNYFRTRARLILDRAPEPDDFCGWLSLMQHYRVPTRLLDWTESPLFAAWFAVYETMNRALVVNRGFTADGALWVLDPNAMNDCFHGDGEIPTFERWNLLKRENHPDPTKHRVKAASNAATPTRMAELVPPAFFHGMMPVAKALAVDPPFLDRRMQTQRSKFTVHGDRTPLEDSTRAGDYLTKLTIPRELRRDMFDELYGMGITPATLFPDPEHLAEDTSLVGFCQERACDHK